MSRLTKRNADGTAWYNHTIFEKPVGINELLERLCHYEDLEEAGRLIELSCKLYEEVWVSHKQFATFKTSFERKSTIVDWMEQGYVIGHTKAEAEAKLAELKGDSEER